ncbi:Rap1a/Tai family immunity protein [Erythrobacter aureus]|uniref:Rap1a immunity protein domain-containing protein n=1 Tax=Erythrobacter aureus TaxID=2182384 RepID=A0A345YJF4_9SPHN|nr:Rap1a/Tai family immunity protein [Erythrobacter aureus]AXK44056.1 hypothetical protein DVR09_16515 [Erythrobacter aureus]
MIFHFLLPLAAAAGSVPSVDMLATDEARNLCVAAAEGSLDAETQCIALIREHADPMLVDEMDPDFQSSCMVVEKISETELIWIFLEWLEEHPDAGDKPASTSITAALFEKLPCGWQER